MIPVIVMTLSLAVSLGRALNHRKPILLALVGLALAAVPRCCPADAPELAESHVAEVGNEERALLENVAEYLKQEQWDEAVETVMRLMQRDETNLIAAHVESSSPDSLCDTLVPLRDYCQAELASWARRAPIALARYRQRVDPLARQWFLQASKTKDDRLLHRVVDQMLLSSSGDDALFLIGEIALERGNYMLARQAWQRIDARLRVPTSASRTLSCPPGVSWWTALRGLDLSPLKNTLQLAFQRNDNSNRLAIPDSDIPLARLLSCLVLTSLLEGNLDRATLELELLQIADPKATGTISGRTGVYQQMLSDWLGESRKWAAIERERGWRSVGGGADRRHTIPQALDPICRPLWQLALPVINVGAERIGFGRHRVAEGQDGLLGYFPAVDRGVVYVRQAGCLRAIQAIGGVPAWPSRSSSRRSTDLDYGTIYRFSDSAPETVPTRSAFAGVPRYGVTIDRGRLFARMGTAWTGGGSQSLVSADQRSCLVGLDLRTQKLLFDRIYARESGWEFEAAPVADTEHVYVSLRRRDTASAQTRVDCYSVDTGRLVWRTDIARAQALGGVLFELTNAALTLHDERLYYNSNLGVVAALTASDGHLVWAARYARSDLGRGLRGTDQHYFRDINPCLVDDDLVIAAPADSSRIMAFDAVNGQLVWATTQQQAVDAVHLLGTGQGRLIASGDYLYWIDLATGRLTGQFPAARNRSAGYAAPTPCGFGRGLLAGNNVYWPTRERVYVFDQAGPRPVRQPIELAAFGLEGGNLVATEGLFLIASSDRLTAFADASWLRSAIAEGPR